MSQKLQVKTRHPYSGNIFLNGEVVEVKEKEENPNMYTLLDGTIIYVHLDPDSVSLPIDPKYGKYFKNRRRGKNVQHRLPR